ncbi:MAG: DsrE family protein [Candidatus Nanohalobium sp.]
MKTVFHLNTNDKTRQSELLGNIQNLISDKTTEVEEIAVVLNGDAVKMLEKGSEAAEFIREYPEKVSFKACSNSVENREVDEDKIIEDAELVSSGVAELNRLQENDFNYIKVN